MTRAQARLAVVVAALAATALVFTLVLLLGSGDDGGEAGDTRDNLEVRASCATQIDPPLDPAALSALPQPGETFDLDGIVVTLPDGFDLPLPGARFADGVTIYAPSDGTANASGLQRYAILVYDDSTSYLQDGQPQGDPLTAYATDAGTPIGELEGCLEYTYVDRARATWSFRTTDDELQLHEMKALSDGRYVEFWSHVPLGLASRDRQTAAFELIAESVELAGG
jgi:hypothetical protein